jgi:four helix bundle protein
MEVFKLTQQFPREELYSLTTQMRNASRSIPANIAEGWGKHQYPMVFTRHLFDAIGSANEMLAWLDTALACKYVEAPVRHELVNAYEVLARRLHQLLVTWRTFR